MKRFFGEDMFVNGPFSIILSVDFVTCVGLVLVRMK
jgi:hypothetical protein